jgi:hypothetical protein
MTEQQRLELQRIKSILSAATGFEDDDQEYIEDARKAVCRLLDEQGSEPVQSLQCAHCHVTIETLNDKVMRTLAALKEWSDKTEWVQETAQPLELGMHRADVLKQRIERLKASIALDKMADNARELGLSYDDAVKGGVGIMLGGKRIDPASIYADAPPKQDVPETNFGNITEPKIGCVNHDCDQCREKNA